MGRAALYDLAGNPEIEKLGVFDLDGELASKISVSFGQGKAVAAQLDASDTSAAAQALSDYDAAVSCAPYSMNLSLTQAAIEAGCHLVDLGGNNDVVQSQFDLNDQAKEAGVIIIPDCGLAPGMVSIIAAAGIANFEKVNSLQIRVGGLPQAPRGPLKYQIVFSAEGLVNEYWEPCQILEDGQPKTVNPMTGLEELEFDGIGPVEAFYTSGGISTLPMTYRGQIDNIDYKTIRYPGHCHLLKPMLELGLASRQPVNVHGSPVEPRALFKAVLEKNLSYGDPDLVLVRVTLQGTKEGKPHQMVYEIIDRQNSRTGLTAMMRTTAFPAAIIATMAAAGQITVTGVNPQEIVVKPELFLPQLKKRDINLVVTS